MITLALLLTPLVLSVGIETSQASQDATTVTKKSSIVEVDRPHGLLAAMKELSQFADKKIGSRLVSGDFSKLFAHLATLQKQEEKQGEMNARVHPETQSCLAALLENLNLVKIGEEMRVFDLVIKERHASEAAKGCTSAHELLWKFADGSKKAVPEDLLLKEVMKTREYAKCKNALNDILRGKRSLPHLDKNIATLDKHIAACEKLKQRLEPFTKSDN